MYKSRRWQKLRVSLLREHPLCVRCENAGVIRLASVIDHCLPAREYTGDFFDEDNLFPVCTQCHSDITKNWDNRNAHRLEKFKDNYSKYKYSNREDRRGSDGFMVDEELTTLLNSLELVGTSETAPRDESNEAYL